MTLKSDVPCHSRCDMLTYPLHPMVIHVENKSKYEVLHKQWGSLYMSTTKYNGQINI